MLEFGFCLKLIRLFVGLFLHHAKFHRFFTPARSQGRILGLRVLMTNLVQFLQEINNRGFVSISNHTISSAIWNQ